MSQDSLPPPPPPAPPAAPPPQPPGGGQSFGDPPPGGGLPPGGGQPPGGGLPPTGDADGPRIPWEDRDSLGYLDALIETVKLLFTSPSEAFSRLRADGDLIWPIVFGLIFGWLGQVFTQMWNLLFGSAISSMMMDLGDMGDFGQFAQMQTTSFLEAVVTIIIFPVIYVIFLFISAGLFHLCLMLVGSTNESPTGFEGTVKVLAYSGVANLAAVIPFVGGLIALPIWIVLMTLGFTQVHATSQGKALTAVLIPIVLCCVCCIAGVVMFGASMAAMMAGAGG